MYDDQSVLIKYNCLLLAEGRRKLIGNVYFIFDDLKYLYRYAFY